MKICPKIFKFFLLFFVFLALCSCGKTSKPLPLEGSGYPHTYPRK